VRYCWGNYNPHTFIANLLSSRNTGHRDVWNILLQVRCSCLSHYFSRLHLLTLYANGRVKLFDDGHLTDSHGRKVDFRNVIVVMTSNIGAHVIAELPSNLTGSEPAVQETLMEVVRGTLSPELLKCVI
jgi:hypothetical protein